jgi:hypothetical protein
MAALTLAELQIFRDSLVRALATGEKRVRDQNGEEVEYRSVFEMQRALGQIEGRIAAMQSAAPNTIRFKTSKFGDCK